MSSLDASFKLSERTALLTGPCSTINQAIATKLTSLGCNVALVDRNIEKSSRFAEQLMNTREINERFGRAVAIQADLSKPHHVQDAASRAAEAFGGLDIYIDGLLTTEVREFRDPTALDEFDRLIDVNLRSPLYTTHAVLKFLEGRKRGRIIYLQHDIARLGIEKNGLLAATRGGLSDFTRIIAREVAPNNVTANVVSIGISEEFLIQQLTAQSDEKGARGDGAALQPAAANKGSINDALAALKQSFPRAAIADPDKISNLIAFLASPLGAGITGQTISANQGLA
ncbi:MAG: SDR family oxidoreductase [Bdellovibrionales bacterium]|jgi:3-oxoacyl-[acyl-carrier protein] reductase|nr:SDR family oxidoreductase [Bdellovibrionales bacterium]